MKISDRKIDPKMKEEGAWVTDIPGWGDLQLKTRGIGNRSWAKLEQTLLNAVPRKLRINGIDPVERERIDGILLCNTALLDWKNFEDDEGPKPYSKEMANKYLTTPEYEEFRGAARWAATVVAEQGQSEIEEDAGN